MVLPDDPCSGGGRRTRSYIYYRVLVSDVDAATAAVRAVQRRHRSGELLRRPGASEGRVTLMEVYGAGDAARQAAGAAAAAVAPWLDGGRHCELFELIDG